MDDRVTSSQMTICTIMSKIVIVDKSEFQCNHLSYFTIWSTHHMSIHMSILISLSSSMRLTTSHYQYHILIKKIDRGDSLCINTTHILIQRLWTFYSLCTKWICYSYYQILIINSFNIMLKGKYSNKQIFYLSEYFITIGIKVQYHLYYKNGSRAHL